MATAMATKFVEWEVPELDTLQDSKVYRLRHKLNNGGKMNREEKDWLTHNVNFNTYFTTAIPLMGGNSTSPMCCAPISYANTEGVASIRQRTRRHSET